MNVVNSLTSVAFDLIADAVGEWQGQSDWEECIEGIDDFSAEQINAEIDRLVETLRPNGF